GGTEGLRQAGQAERARNDRTLLAGSGDQGRRLGGRRTQAVRKNARVTNIELSEKASPPDADVVVDVRDVYYDVDSRPIFKGLDVTVRRGRITAIMGPSGTGKTTLLRLITAQSLPSRGEVRVFGQDLAQLSSSGIYAMRKRMGMLFQ